jgi:hypothetical protein
MPNTGVAPLDPTTPVGQVRLSLGDTDATNISGGSGSYPWFGDDELNALLTTGSDSVARATGLALKRLALNYALQGRSIKTADLALDSTKRGDSIAAIAQSWLDQADLEDERDAKDTFLIVPFRDRVKQYITPRRDPFLPDPLNPGYLIV